MKWFEFFNKWKMKKKEKNKQKKTNNREALSVLILQEIIRGFFFLSGQTVPQAATLQVDMATKFAIIVANSKTPI